MNLYTYVANDPLNKFDSTGKCFLGIGSDCPPGGLFDAFHLTPGRDEEESSKEDASPIHSHRSDAGLHGTVTVAVRAQATLPLIGRVSGGGGVGTDTSGNIASVAQQSKPADTTAFEEGALTVEATVTNAPDIYATSGSGSSQNVSGGEGIVGDVGLVGGPITNSANQVTGSYAGVTVGVGLGEGGSKSSNVTQTQVCPLVGHEAGCRH
jgi:hypothetical protein